MSKNVKNIVMWGGAGILSFAFMTYQVMSPTLEESLNDAGYTPESKSTLTCYNDDGGIILEENPESVIYESDDPVSVRAIYPSFYNGNRDVQTRVPTVSNNSAGCVFQTDYTSSDIEAVRNNAPMLVTIFNGDGSTLERNYTSYDSNRDNGLFTALLLDESGFILQKTEVIGIPVVGTQIAPALVSPKY